jgi:hypothetical protein
MVQTPFRIDVNARVPSADKALAPSIDTLDIIRLAVARKRLMAETIELKKMTWQEFVFAHRVLFHLKFNTNQQDRKIEGQRLHSRQHRNLL